MKRQIYAKKKKTIAKHLQNGRKSETAEQKQTRDGVATEPHGAKGTPKMKKLSNKVK